MTFNSTRRAAIGIGFVVLLALASAGRQLLRATGHVPGGIEADEAVSYMKRFEPLRSLLPDQGVVGYVGPHPRAGKAENRARRDHYLAQYALSPVLLDMRDWKRDYVIVNFPDAAAARTSMANTTLILVRDFGGGLLLYRSPAP